MGLRTFVKRHFVFRPHPNQQPPPLYEYTADEFCVSPEVDYYDDEDAEFECKIVVVTRTAIQEVVNEEGEGEGEGKGEGEGEGKGDEDWLEEEEGGPRDTIQYSTYEVFNLVLGVSIHGLHSDEIRNQFFNGPLHQNHRRTSHDLELKWQQLSVVVQRNQNQAIGVTSNISVAFFLWMKATILELIFAGHPAPNEEQICDILEAIGDE